MFSREVSVCLDGGCCDISYQKICAGVELQFFGLLGYN